jgi:hypothetical protein
MLKSRIPQIIVEIDVRIAEVIDRGTDQVERDAKVRVPRKTSKLHDGHLVEYGTVRTTPQPFLVPALEENRQDIVDDGQRALRRL